MCDITRHPSLLCCCCNVQGCPQSGQTTDGGAHLFSTRHSHPSACLSVCLSLQARQPRRRLSGLRSVRAGSNPWISVPTVITVQPDRSFTFVTKTPPASYFLKKAAGIEKGTGKPGHEITGTISLKHVYEIAKIKATDEHMKHIPLESVARMIVGSAKSLGVQVVP